MDEIKIKIKQILTNIINNAIKFTNTGHIFVSLKLINTFDMKVDLLIEVLDTGIGILDTDISRLFKPFTQVDETTTRSRFCKRCRCTVRLCLQAF